MYHLTLQCSLIADIRLECDPFQPQHQGMSHCPSRTVGHSLSMKQQEGLREKQKCWPFVFFQNPVGLLSKSDKEQI